MMNTNKNKTKEVTLGKLHDSYIRVCNSNGVGVVDESEFLSLCSLVECRGVISMKKAKNTRDIKISLRMDEKELEGAMQDKTLMSAILSKGL